MLLRRLHALKDRPHLSNLLEIWALRATQLLASEILQYVLQPREYVYNLFVIATKSTDSSP